MREDPGLSLPERALLLTFGDGYMDHADTVFPLLVRNGIQGSFFPPARAILERRVLDVNKIYFLLAAEPDTARIVAALEDQIEVCGLDAWVMCYPFGGFDASLLSILERHGCRTGSTTEVAVADLDAHHPLTLPRIDTNDLPRRADAPRNRWMTPWRRGGLGPGAAGSG